MSRARRALHMVRPEMVAMSSMLGTEIQLRPGYETVGKARWFIATTLRRWNSSGSAPIDLVEAWRRTDARVVDSLVASAVWAHRGAWESRVWACMSQSRWMIRETSRYWLALGARFRWEVTPRWAVVAVDRRRWSVDRCRPLTLRIRLIEDVGGVRIRLEVWDSRLVHEPDPETVAAEMARLAELCVACGRYAPKHIGGWTTWAEVPLSSST